ncbi:ThiF family adenylyltransferase [Lysobacter sp. A289]
MNGTSLEPEWERVFPGYMAWELASLRRRARAVKIDTEKLAQGQLEVTFDWPLRDKWIPLHAVFQSTHPYVRPQVMLRTAPEDWPERHVAPDTGNICLLGRDSAQWQPEWSLADLLERQLEGSLFGGSEEDPQGEPAEYWWNVIGRSQLRDSYCLVDSDWDFASTAGGDLELVVSFEPPAPRGVQPTAPQIRAYVRRVFNKNGETVAEWTMPLPPALASGRVVRVPWHRHDSVLLPRPNIGHRITELRREHFGGPGRREALPGGVNIRPFVFLHPIELDETRTGDGWLVGLEWGDAKDFRDRPGAAPKGVVIPILRAGRSDLGVRVPAIAALAGRKVTVVGVGALGAPIAIELARNGVARLTLIDFDVVEPGNSVRWPLGAPVWGKPKVNALKEHIEAHFPGCQIEPRPHGLGMSSNPTDDELFTDVLADTDLLIDASVSHSVNRLLWDRTQRRDVPMIQLGATPEVRGGTVVHYPVGGPCVLCLQHARIAGTVDEPAGSDDERRVQPAGCGERTFVGADYDLQELSMQAIRQAVAVVSGSLGASVVDTLDLAADGDRSAPPVWRRQTLESSPECNCWKIRDAPAPSPAAQPN